MDALLRRHGILRGSKYVRDYTHGMNGVPELLPSDVTAWIVTHDLVKEGRKFHSRYVLKIPLERENVSCIDGQFFRLKKDSALLIFPYQIHSNPPVSGTRGKQGDLLIVGFSLSHAGGQRLAGLRNRVIPLRSAWREKLSSVIAAYQGSGEVSPEEAVYTLAGVLADMSAEYPEEVRTVTKSGEAEKICEYIKAHYREPLNVKTIADRFSVSPSTLQRLFRNALGSGITPGVFLEKVRLQHAIELLIYTKKTIAETASECGFRDPFGFSRAFRRLTGLPPRTFRLRGGI